MRAKRAVRRASSHFGFAIWAPVPQAPGLEALGLRIPSFGSGALGEGRPLRDESDAERDEHNAGPAFERNGLVQPEARKQRDDHVAKRGGRKTNVRSAQESAVR